MSTLGAIRRWILAVLLLGLASTGVDLFLIEHYASASQAVPLVVVSLALLVLAWHAIRRDRLSIRALQATMIASIVAGLAGMALHFRGGAQFQLEIDAEQHRWDIVTKVMRAESPPVLASGMFVQLGLLGLVYAYRHPALGAPQIRD